jgi:uncharacterized Zn finger protein (UPF0148 family)
MTHKKNHSCLSCGASYQEDNGLLSCPSCDGWLTESQLEEHLDNVLEWNIAYPCSYFKKLLRDQKDVDRGWLEIGEI